MWVLAGCSALGQLDGRPQQEAGSQAPARQRSQIPKLDENSGLHMGLPWGHHSLRGTERRLSEQILVLGSNWEGDFLSPEIFLFHIQSLFSVFGSHVPGLRPYQPPPTKAAILRLKLEPQIPGADQES